MFNRLQLQHTVYINKMVIYGSRSIHRKYEAEDHGDAGTMVAESNIHEFMRNAGKIQYCDLFLFIKHKM